MCIHREQTSQTASYSLGCKALSRFFSSFPFSLSSLVCTRSVNLLRVQVLLQINAQFFPKRFEITQVFIVLALIFDFGLDACVAGMSFFEQGNGKVSHAPSKTRTAVGKSLTRLAALRAAVMTEGDGTRS